MATVGHDKRLNYYQQTADEVIAELRSHLYGLTNPEAARRLEQNGSNALPYGAPHSPVHDVLNQAKTWPAVLLLVGVALSLWQQDAALALSFLGIAAAVTLTGAWRERHVGALRHNLDTVLPRQVTVRRNGIDTVIDAQHVVVGDLVVLEPGTKLAADIRLIEADQLLIDDSFLHSSHAHIHKFAHALVGHLPLHARNNLAFAGTIVMHGTGVGVVTAIGAQTEAGKLLSLTEVTQQKTSLFHQRLARQSNWVAVGLFLLVAATGLLAILHDWSLQTSQTLLLALVASLVPAGLLLSVSLMFALGANRSKRSGVQFRAPSALDRLGATDIALIDDLDFVVDAVPTVQQILIGKQTHDVVGDGYDPSGSVLGRTSKPLGRKAINDLQLFFEAAALCNHAKLLPPDADNTAWHGVGPSNDRLLVTLAARVGYHADTIRAAHPLVRHFPFDLVRHMGSTIHTYNHKPTVFVHGEALHVLSAITHLWDGGHTRACTAADIARLRTYAEAQAQLGNQVIALAYRKLTPQQLTDTITAADTEQNLTLLGLVAIGRPTKAEAPQTIHSLQNEGVTCSLLTSQHVVAAQTTASALGLARDTVIDSLQLSQLADSHVLELLREGCIFSHLTGEDRLRLVDIAQRSGHHVLLTGRTLSHVPAMHHASVSIASAAAPTVVQDEADALLLDAHLQSLNQALNRSRHLLTNIGNVLQGAFTDGVALVLVASIGIGLLAWQHIPLALPPVMMLALLVLLQPLLASSLDTDTLETRPSPVSMDSRAAQVFLAVAAAGLGVGSFLLYFMQEHLSSRFIDASSSLYYQAATTVLVSLVFIQWINLLFIRANHTQHLTSPRLWQNRNVWWTLAISLLILGNVIYNPLLQHMLHTQALGLASWVIVASSMLLYTALRWIVRVERKHSRRAIVALHQEVHGQHAEPRI